HVGEVGKPPRALGVVVAVVATELGGVMGIGRVGTDAGEIHVDSGVVVIATAVAGKIGCNGFVAVGGGDISCADKCVVVGAVAGGQIALNPDNPRRQARAVETPSACARIVLEAAIVVGIALAKWVGSAVTGGGAANAVVLWAAGGRVGRQVIITVGNAGDIAHGNALLAVLHVKGVVGAGAVEVGV